MRVLVTGCQGFIGTRLFAALDDDVDVFVVDEQLGMDVCAPSVAGWIRGFDPEVVYHLAARHYIPWCEDNPEETMRTNVGGTKAIMDALGPSVETFVLASSAAVYGFADEPIRENHPLDGMGIYAWSKQLAETLLYLFSANHPDVRCVAARLFNVVGAGDAHPHVLPSIVAGLCSSRAATLGNPWPLRDYVHVDDATRALVYLEHKAPVGLSAFNIGTGIGTSVSQLADLVVEVAGAEGLNAEVGQGRRDDGHLVADPAALLRLGWKPEHTLREAIQEVIGVVHANT